MNAEWKTLPFPGMAALVNNDESVAAVIKQVGGFALAFMAHPDGALHFKKITGRFHLLGAYPSLRRAGLAATAEHKAFLMGGQYLRMLTTG
jgi:hypothetical protein